jgi:hypothetical protein
MSNSFFPAMDVRPIDITTPLSKWAAINQQNAQAGIGNALANINSPQGQQLSQAAITAADDAFSEGARWAALAAAIFLAAGLASTFNLGSRKHDE